MSNQVPSESPGVDSPAQKQTSRSGIAPQATVQNLRAALSAVRRRQQWLTLLQHLAWLVAALAVLLLGFSVLSWLLPDLYALQLALFVVFVAAAGVAVWRFLKGLGRLRTDDRQLASFVESRMPDLEQRLLTSLEFSSGSDAAERAGVSALFVQQLWVDAESHLREQHERLDQVTDTRRPRLAAISALAAMAVAAVAFLSSDTLLRAGSQLLWPFALKPEPVVAVAEPEEALPPVALDISVEPGDIRMQRGRSVSINVVIENGSPANVRLRMQSDQLNWSDVVMREEGSGSNGAVYSWYMPAVDNDTVYYVSVDVPEGTPGAINGEQRSQQYTISLYDLPQAEQIDLAYQYPSYTGLENTAETDGGDMIAPEGTEVSMSVTFNKAVQSADIVFDDDSRVPLAVDGINGTATLTINRDTGYRIVATDFDRLQTEDPDVYYIRSIPDQPPQLALRSPGRDQDVMPLEEVILEVDASDDYGLSEFTLHYSVVGGEEQSISFLPSELTRSITGNQMIFMEDLLVQPGDFVSYYLTLADNNGLRGPQEVVSDIYFLQVIPTDQEFRRASGGQQGGGGGGGGNDSSSALVTLQKDIIAATWRLRQQQLNMDQQQFTDDVAVLAESQREAMQRARMSIDRLSERINFADDSYGNAVTYLQRAIAQMEQAAGELDNEALTSAMQPEQQALQMVLRAEAEINRTDVNFQRQAGGGGGGGDQQEREDLRELFEMEMGQNENRYETPRSARGGQQANTEESSRLEELARRQESLTRAQRNLARRMEDLEEEQRRRELERLRREQEQLSNELAQLQQQMSRRQQIQSQQNSQQAGGASGGNQQTASTEQMQRALQQMQEAAEAESPAQAAARSQRALESLREQQRQMAQQPANSASQLAQNLAQRGQELIEQQRQLQQQLQTLNEQQGLGQTRQANANSNEVQELTAQQERNRQALQEIERMLRAVIARAGAEEQQLLSQAQQANRAIRPALEQMDTANRVLRNGMVNLAMDIEQEVADSLRQLGQNLQALGNGGQAPVNRSEDPVMQAAADASALRSELERLQQEIDARQSGDQGEASIAEMRQQLERSRQLAQQLAEQLGQGQPGQQAGQQSRRGQLARQQGQPGQQQQGQQAGQPGQQQGQQQAQAGQQGGQQPGQQAQSGQQQGGQQDGNGQIAAGGRESNQFNGGRSGIPAEGEAALWGNARSIASEITRQSLEEFMNQPELLRGLLQPLIELESDLRARAELAQISRRLFTVSEEDIPDQYRQLVESYYRALSETG
ncbi:MAG TPA: DUF4175 family protein, partial [Pseudohongiella sp.]|nr:DUF4175 family protein [Pseudohongiella sp.]